MGKRGPAAKPTALKILQGNPGRRPINKNEPRPDATKPRAPKFLCKAGRDEWDRLAKRLHRIGVLTYIDRGALAGYCQSYGRWVEAERMISEINDQVIQRESGMLVINPWVKVAQIRLDQTLKLAKEFGLTPASRSRLVIGDDGTEKVESIDDVLGELFTPVED